MAACPGSAVTMGGVPNTPAYAFPYLTLSDAPDGAALGLGLATAVETQLIRIDAAAAALSSRTTTLEGGPNTTGFGHFSVGESTSSPAFADLGAGSSVSFTKRYTGTKVLVTMDVDFQTSSTGAGVEFGILLNSVDYLIASLHQTLPVANARLHTSGAAILSPGIAAGTYAVKGRWRRTGGAGTITRYAGDDRISCILQEVG